MNGHQEAAEDPNDLKLGSVSMDFLASLPSNQGNEDDVLADLTAGSYIYTRRPYAVIPANVSPL